MLCTILKSQEWKILSVYSMELSELTVKLIILFLPGIIATSIYQLFGNRNNLDNRSFFVLTIVNGFFSYLPLEIFTKQDFLFRFLLDTSLQPDLECVFKSIIASIILGICEVYLINYGMLYCIARKIRLTTRSGHDTVWDEVFDNQNQGITNYVYVLNEKSNKLYAGTVENYSMSKSGKIELLLNNVTVYDAEERTQKLYSINQVYLNLTNTSYIEIEIGESYGGKTES